MKHPWIKRRPNSSNSDFEGTLLDDAASPRETVDLLPEELVRRRGDGVVYPDSFDEVRDRPPWTPDAWEKLGEILDGAMANADKLRLATDVSDFIEGRFFPGVVPKVRRQQIGKFTGLAEAIAPLIVLLRNDQDVRSLKGSSFSDSLAKRLDELASHARATASVKQDEEATFQEKTTPRGNTQLQDFLLRSLTNHFLATGHEMSGSRDPDGVPTGRFADYLRLIWSLLRETEALPKSTTFIRRGYRVARRMGVDRTAKRGKRST